MFRRSIASPGLVDDRTLEILEKRRRASIPQRRGWLVRRTLLVADLVGLAVAFLVAQLLFGPEGAPNDHVGPNAEYLLVLLTLPGWVVVAKLYNLYDHDEERADHSSVLSIEPRGRPKPGRRPLSS